MATSSIPLPMELVIEIIKSFEDRDMSDDPAAEHQELGAREAAKDSVPWLTASKSMKEDIINIRLVCKQFRDAAYESFARILSDRIFRWTRVGLGDLKGIAAQDNLTSWVRTITFGCAQFGFSSRAEHKLYLCLSASTIQRLYAEELMLSIDKEYNTESRRKAVWLDDTTCAVRKLAAVFKAFPRLQNVRIVAHDRPVYLGGWLSQEEAQTVSSQYEAHSPTARSTHLMYDADRSQTNRTRLLYWSDRRRVAPCLFQAFKDAETSLKDLQVSDALHLSVGHGFAFISLLPTLRTLCITVRKECFKSEGSHNVKENSVDTQTSFLNVLASLTNLEIISLSLGAYILHFEYETKYEYMSKAVFEALQRPERPLNLRRVELTGTWAIQAKDLSVFVEKHAASLQSLILHSCTLHGPLLRTLQCIASITRQTLKFISIRCVEEATVDEVPDEVNILELYDAALHFDCATDFDYERY